jgi:hypothetical protein
VIATLIGSENESRHTAASEQQSGETLAVLHGCEDEGSRVRAGGHQATRLRKHENHPLLYGKNDCTAEDAIVKPWSH